MQDTHERSGDRYAPVRAFVRDLGDLVERSGRTSDTVLAIKERLAELIRQRPELPAQVKTLGSDHYARHLLYGDPGGRFEVVVMAWSPGQETPIHDHSGMWCVEGVVQGVIDVTRYDLKEMIGDDEARMERTEVIHAGLGQCGALIPPVEYHRIANPYESAAFTIHVYGGRMRACRIFERRTGDTYGIAMKPLGFTYPEAALPPS
jgi:3-mercaptopropionate dioxygenase